MNWANVKLILMRETRDQLRDRRTLFMIAVLPLLLYPLLGTILLQVAQFRGEHPTKILLIGGDQLPATPRLVEKPVTAAGAEVFASRHFEETLLARPADKRLLVVDVQPQSLPANAHDVAERQVRAGVYDAVVILPDDFASRLSEFRELLQKRLHGDVKVSDDPTANDKPLSVPDPIILFDAGKEKSQLARSRVAEVLRRWTEAIGQQNMLDSKMPGLAARPFEPQPQDIAATGGRDAALWSKILPFIVLIWALTGAFYPAVDLCAGEKERGTLETLLSSPAQRSEIATGKLLTIMIFSMITSILNLLSMGITTSFVVTQLGPIFPNMPLALPSWHVAFWLIIALIPMSALFSALCLALAAFARSTKEGQYYLMPLLIVTMPLVMLPMLPGMEMDLGNSLIPVTNVVLLLRMLLEGNYWQALPYVFPTALVTLLCCLMATRWAIDQFNSESVLFRESERLDLSLWMKHMLRDREDTPPIGAAVMCGVLILVIRFYIGLKVTMPTTFAQFASQTGVLQLAAVLTPVLLMTVMLTRKPRETLLLKTPRWQSIPFALLLAFLIHPLVIQFSKLVQVLYPLNPAVAEQSQKLQELILGEKNLWLVLSVLALLPAVVEELAFRGFILSGFRHTGSKWRAIVLSAVFFGLTHATIQQSLITAVVGVVIGYIAVQSNSLLPGVCFHIVHNSLALLIAKMTPGEWVNRQPARLFVSYSEAAGWQYQPALLVLCGAGAAGVLWWFHKLAYPKTREEVLHDAIRQQAATPLPES